MSLHRRLFLAAGASVAAPAVWSQAGHAHHGSHGTPPALPVAPPSAEPYARLRDGQPHHLTADQTAQRSFQSPAPAGPAGRWVARAALPIPRSEMAWATEWAGRMHVIGGYGEGRVDRGYHHVYETRSDTWFNAAALPRGANHVAVVADKGRIYAFGGFIEQNRNPDPTLMSMTWQPIAGHRSRPCHARVARPLRWPWAVKSI